MSIPLQEILSVLGQEYAVMGSHDIAVDKIAPAAEAGPGALVWLRKLPEDPALFAANSPATVFFMPLPAPAGLEAPKDKTLVFTADPRLAAITVLARFFRKTPAWSWHPTAIIDPAAQVDPETFIGPHTYIGKCKIGKGCILYGNNYLYDGVSLGNDVTIHAGTVIGADGFGYAAGHDREWLKFEHLGGVEIGHGVEIGANTCIDRGTLGNTLIGDGTKIDNLVHIAHNVRLGRHCLVIAHAMIGGSSVIEDHAWVAPHAAILQKTTVGQGATVGLGAVVLQNVPPGETWAGVPAHKLDQNKPG